MNRLVSLFLIGLLVTATGFSTPLHTAVDSGNVTSLDSLLAVDPALLEAVNENGETPLFHAASNGHEDWVRALLDKNTDFNKSNSNGTLPIHTAAQHGSLPIVRMLISAGADPRATDATNGGTALHWAADGGNCETLGYLIALGLDIQNPDQAMFTPLMRAASRGHKAAFDLLLSHGAELKIGAETSNDVMGQAAGGGNAELVQFLLDKGFDINARTSNLSAPIHIAVWRQQPEMVKYLLGHGAHLDGVRNRFGSTPLHSAAFHGDTAMAEILLANGSTVFDSSTQDYSTALHMAALMGRTEMIGFLLDRGADINRLDRGGTSPLGGAVINNQREAAEYLINRGAIVDPTACPEKFPCAEYLSSPLHIAVQHGSELVDLLLEHGASPNSRDSEGRTPLMFASRSDSLRCLELLLAKGAQPNASDERGCTPLHMVTRNGKWRQGELLLNGGADPNLADREKMTPLHIAAMVGCDTLAEKLIAAGSKINAKDKHGHRPLYYAQYYGHDKLAELLISHGAKGGMKKPISEQELLTRELGDGEAIVWYLSHSGWAMKTRDHLLVFDYFPLSLEVEQASLLNGRVNPQQLSDVNLAVFASHEHNDHADPVIFTWKEHCPDIAYYMGVHPEQIRVRPPISSEGLDYTLCRPGETVSQNGIEIRPIKSDIDQGCGFLIRVDGLTILHPGDAVDTSRVTPSPYTQTVDSLAAETNNVDLFFFPIRGCGFPDLEAVKKGVDYAIAALQPQVALPMHARDVEYELQTYARDARQRGANANYHCVRQPGERFLYSKGKITPL